MGSGWRPDTARLEGRARASRKRLEGRASARLARPGARDRASRKRRCCISGLGGQEDWLGAGRGPVVSLLIETPGSGGCTIKSSLFQWIFLSTYSILGKG